MRVYITNQCENVQCNLMFQFICDKYFPIMAWQRDERSGTAGRPIAPWLSNSNHVYRGKASVSNPARVCRLSNSRGSLAVLILIDILKQYYYFKCLFIIFSQTSCPGISFLSPPRSGSVLSVVPSNLKCLPKFCWCKSCLQVSFAICLLPGLSPQVISTTEFP